MVYLCKDKKSFLHNILGPAPLKLYKVSGVLFLNTVLPKRREIGPLLHCFLEETVKIHVFIDSAIPVLEINPKDIIRMCAKM